ncbi:MAG: hypothetical protein IPL21_03235 [Saprospirales bacterium]|nr:hypothetical protein [Saprospirales bacterium]
MSEVDGEPVKNTDDFDDVILALENSDAQTIENYIIYFLNKGKQYKFCLMKLIFFPENLKHKVFLVHR